MKILLTLVVLAQMAFALDDVSLGLPGRITQSHLVLASGDGTFDLCGFECSVKILGSRTFYLRDRQLSSCAHDCRRSTAPGVVPFFATYAKGETESLTLFILKDMPVSQPKKRRHSGDDDQPDAKRWSPINPGI